MPRATQPTFTTDVTIQCITCATVEDLQSVAFHLAARDVANRVLAHVQETTDHRGACTIASVTPLTVTHEEVVAVTARVHVTCDAE